ncbi:hypothetical protein [Leucobacter muris]|uniref:hypothetical protein n=1 Tax=Leucobacter muris TaxID=1935379 RepID=UPI0013E313BF|nr:hypothetical protein [Leucobacter muris]
MGGAVSLTGTGFLAGENVIVTLPDGSKRTVATDASGGFTTAWVVPAGFAPGLASFGALGDTSGRTANASATVLAQAGPGGGTPGTPGASGARPSAGGAKLSTTGSDLAALAPAGALLLLAGAGVILASRRRRADVTRC